MDTDTSWVSELLGTWSGQFQSAAQYTPGLVGAAAVLLLGYVLARLARRAVRILANASNRFLGRQLSAGPMEAVRLSPLMITLLAEVLFWVVVVVAATLAVRIAGFGMIAQWLDRLAIYLPNLVAAFVILVVGFLLSVFIRERLAPQDEAPGMPSRWAWLAPAIQGLVIALALLIGLDQMGIDVGLLVALTVVAAAGVTLTLGATFALGARQHAANLIGVRSARAQISVGQWLRIDGVEGQVVEFSTTQIVLDTEQGRVLLPGHFLDERVATILYRDAAGEGDHG